MRDNESFLRERMTQSARGTPDHGGITDGRPWTIPEFLKITFHEPTLHVSRVYFRARPGACWDSASDVVSGRDSRRSRCAVMCRNREDPKHLMLPESFPSLFSVVFFPAVALFLSWFPLPLLGGRIEARQKPLAALLAGFYRSRWN